MTTKPKKNPLWRWLMWIGLAVVVLMILAIGLGLAWLYAQPLPKQEELAKADQRYAEVQALFHAPNESPNLPTSQTLATVSASDLTTTGLPLAADWNRCDRLFLEILDRIYSGPFETPAANMQWDTRNDFDWPLAQALELADLYDSGARVSPEAKRYYRLMAGLRLMELAQAIAKGAKPGDGKPPDGLNNIVLWNQLDPAVQAEAVGRVEPALKFLRVIDCPVWQMTWQTSLSRLLDPKDRKPDDPLPTLPQPLMDLNLELLAPSGPLDWAGYSSLFLGYAHDLRTDAERLLDPAYAFRWSRKMMHPRVLPDQPWNNRLIQVARLGMAAFVAVVGPRTKFASQVRTQIECEGQAASYAAAVVKPEGNSLAESKPVGGMIYFRNEQVLSRLIAGAIALRRGAAIPLPDQIGPDSYFFDPVFQRPYRFCQVRLSDAVTRLLILRTTLKGEQDVLTVLLPTGHPGLDAVPPLP